MKKQDRDTLLAKRKKTNRELEANSNVAAGAVPSGDKPWDRVLRCAGGRGVGGWVGWVGELMVCRGPQPFPSSPRPPRSHMTPSKLPPSLPQSPPPSVITFNREDAKGPHVAKDTFKELSRFRAVLLAAKAANVPVDK